MSGCHFVGNVAYAHNYIPSPGISCICPCHSPGLLPNINSPIGGPCCSCRQQYPQFQQPSITISHSDNTHLKLRVELLEARLKDLYAMIERIKKE